MGAGTAQAQQTVPGPACAQGRLGLLKDLQSFVCEVSKGQGERRGSSTDKLGSKRCRCEQCHALWCLFSVLLCELGRPKMAPAWWFIFHLWCSILGLGYRALTGHRSNEAGQAGLSRRTSIWKHRGHCFKRRSRTVHSREEQQVEIQEAGVDCGRKQRSQGVPEKIQAGLGDAQVPPPEPRSPPSLCPLGLPTACRLPPMAVVTGCSGRLVMTTRACDLELFAPGSRLFFCPFRPGTVLLFVSLDQARRGWDEQMVPQPRRPLGLVSL